MSAATSRRARTAGVKPDNLTGRQQKLLRRKVRGESDLALAELHSFLAEHEAVEVHISIISRTLSALGLPLQKRV